MHLKQHFTAEYNTKIYIIIESLDVSRIEYIEAVQERIE